MLRLDRGLDNLGVVRVSTSSTPPIREATHSDALRLGTFHLSQSGAAMPIDYGERDRAPFVPPELVGSAKALEISNGHTTNVFAIDAEGRLEPNAYAKPLGRRAYDVALVLDYGERYTGSVDVSRVGGSHSGYVPVTDLALTPEPPPPPTLPEEVRLDALLVSQSGSVMKGRPEARNQQPLVPALPDAFERLELTADRNGVRTTNTFALTASGEVVPNLGARPLGNVPYEVTLVAKDGTRYRGAIDLTKTGVRHSGYEAIRDLRLTRADVAIDTPLTERDAAFVASGGHTNARPSLAGSPLGLWYGLR